MKPLPIRLDDLLVQTGLTPSKSKALALIMAGDVEVDGQIKTKGWDKIRKDASIRVISRHSLRYASRGGLKLEGAVRQLSINPAGKVAVDVGSSTGGFTDCLLQAGAQMVYAVDVGKGLLDLKLRNDPRVRLIEKLNARHINPGLFNPKPSLATIDVSFISLTKILLPVIQCLETPFEVLALVKPQFEVGKGKTKGGVVRDEALRRETINQIKQFGIKDLGLVLAGECPSAIPGPKGNTEHFLYFKDLKGD